MPDRTAGSGEGPAHLAMLLAALIFGINYVVGRWAVGDVPAYTIGFTRWTIGACILLPFAWRHIGADRAWLASNWKLLVLAGFLMPFMGAGVTYVALIYTEAVNAGVLLSALPVFTIILSWLVLHERPTIGQWLGAAVAIVGVLAIVSRGRPETLLGLSFNIGDAILTMCTLGLAGYAVVVRRMSTGYHPLTLLTLVCAVGAMIHAPLFVVEMISHEPFRLSTPSIVSLVYVAIYPSVIAIMAWNYAIQRLGASRAGLYMYLVPVFAAMVALPLLGETVGLYHLIGAGLIIAGVTVSTRRPQVSPAAKSP